MAIRTMRRFLTFLTLLVLPWQAAATDLPKIVSLNMCADAYLMAIAAPEQILALSYLSRDAALSPFHERAATLPVTHGGLEEILALKPQLVIVSPYSSAMKQQVLQSQALKLSASPQSRFSRRRAMRFSRWAAPLGGRHKPPPIGAICSGNWPTPAMPIKTRPYCPCSGAA